MGEIQVQPEDFGTEANQSFGTPFAPFISVANYHSGQISILLVHKSPSCGLYLDVHFGAEKSVEHPSFPT